MVLRSSSTSWWRNGPIARLIWHIGNFCIPFAQKLPLNLYLAYLAAWGAFIGVLLLMVLHRVIMRLLLAYRGWLYQNPREQSKLVLMWGAFLHCLVGKHPMTYSFQSALPRQPVPALHDTIQRYLETVEPLLSKKEFEETKKEALRFETEGIGVKCQKYLKLKSWWASNYVTDWWERYVYLKGRTSLMINSNYYAMDSAKYLPTTVQEARAGSIIHKMLKFKRLLDHEELEPLLIRGIVPLCMKQYDRMFSTTRIPRTYLYSLLVVEI